MITHSYTAGIVDAEGSIGLQPTCSGPYSYIYPRMSVSNTDLRLLGALQEAYGGAINAQPMKGKLGIKQVYIWRIHKQPALLTLLSQISPWLIVKRESAERILGPCPIANFGSAERFGWLAGLFDGDGSIIITNKSAGAYTRVDLRLATVSTSLAELLVQTIGGGICHRQASGVGRQAIYLWQSYRQKDNISVLKSIAPFLITKREKAEEAIAVIEHLQQRRINDHPSRRPEVQNRISQALKLRKASSLTLCSACKERPARLRSGLCEPCWRRRWNAANPDRRLCLSARRP